MEKTRDKMKNWKDKVLSAAGKEVMIKAVVQSVPTYVMSGFELPKHICNEMHRCMAEFWWGDSDRGRKIHWVAWDKMCAPKDKGGLGFRNMELFNQALLAKQGSDASYVWRSLLKGRELLRKGIWYQVRNGESISVWHEPWIPRPCTFKTHSTVMEGLEDLKLADLIDPATRYALAHRIALEDQSCLFCKCEQETPLHVFKDCKVIACMWLCSPLGLRARNEEASSMSEWFELMMEILQKSQLEVFVMLLWAIWIERNNILWNRVSFDPAHTVGWSLKLLEEYHRAIPGMTNGRKTRAVAKWEFPPPGRLKINCDGAFRSNGEGRAAVVVRNEEGTFVGAHAVKLPLHSPLQAEAEACRMGICSAMRHGWKEVVIESDCSVLVAAMQQQGTVQIEVSRIVEDCRAYMSYFDFIVFRHVLEKQIM
ncbi:hypothetical protein ACLB2K_053193 [Fragaria x ananassa]